GVWSVHSGGASPCVVMYMELGMPLSGTCRPASATPGVELFRRKNCDGDVEISTVILGEELVPSVTVFHVLKSGEASSAHRGGAAPVVVIVNARGKPGAWIVRMFNTGGGNGTVYAASFDGSLSLASMS